MKPSPLSLHIVFALPPLMACQPDAAPGGPVEPGTTSGTSTATDEPLPTTGTPTTGTSTTTSQTGTDPGSTSTGDIDPGTTHTASETTSEPAPTCGDAHLDPGEECDLGAAINDDHTSDCTLACKTPLCGDKLLREGEESCDYGKNNNDSLYGGCTTQCQWGDRCSDGEVQGPEECDLAADNGSDRHPGNSVPCDSGCRFQARVAFLSSLAYKGGELGGVEGAHLKCQGLAAQAEFDNSSQFMAWISDAQHSPLQDFAHGPQTVGLAYVSPSGVRIADDWKDLLLNGPGDGIVTTETGEVVLGAYVWTGTAPNGKLFDPAATCDAWTSSKPTFKSRTGLSGVDKQQVPAWTQWVADKQWTTDKTQGCSFACRIYCVEQ